MVTASVYTKRKLPKRGIVQGTPSAGVQQKKRSGLKTWHVCLIAAIVLSPVIFLVGVAVLAFCVGLAVPFFQDNLVDAQQTKARQDIDVIRNAITLHDAQNRPISGTKLTPLLGRYLMELPNDPWGNPYLLDANVGLILSYGADAIAGGKGSDEDIFSYYKGPITIERVQYEGAFGIPQKGNKLIITLSKAFELVDENALFKSLEIMTGGGAGVSLAELNAKHGHSWKLGAETDRSIGKLVIVNQSNGTSQPIEGTMSMNFSAGRTNVESNDKLLRFGLKETWVKNGPLDSNIYSTEVRKYLRTPEAVGSSGGRAAGVKIERY